MSMHRVFISYHHDNDEHYKDELLRLNRLYNIFDDGSVDTGDIDENLSDEAIRVKIRDAYLKNTSVTIVLVGTETANRKHIDWEIQSSMYDGKVNKKSGILVVYLPTATNGYDVYERAGHRREETDVFSDIVNWTNLYTREQYVENYPLLPDIIYDNLINTNAKISIVKYNRIISRPTALATLIDNAYNDRTNCNYDLRRDMRRRNS